MRPLNGIALTQALTHGQSNGLETSWVREGDTV